MNKKQINILLEAGNYYLNDATQYGNETEKYFQESCGLNTNDPRYKLLKSALEILREKNDK